MQLMIQSGDLGPKWFHVALRAMVMMSESKTKLKSNYIAEVIGEDSTFVRKILAGLAKADLIKSYGGRYGGYCLGKEPNDITVRNVYNALGIYPQTPISSVPTTGTELFISLIISKAEEKFESVLDSYTIEDILKHKIKNA